MKYIVEQEYFRNGILETTESSIFDSFADAMDNAIRFGFVFTKEDGCDSLILYQAPSVGYLVEKCLYESAFGDDGSIDWGDYDPDCIQTENHGFFGQVVAEMVTIAYNGVDSLTDKEDILDDFSKDTLKRLCITASDLGIDSKTIDIGSGSAEECIDAFNESCRQLNVCRRHKDGNSELLRVDYNW